MTLQKLDFRFSSLATQRASSIKHRAALAEAVRPNGLTLVELLVSIAITTILMLAIGSVMLIATHAFPDVNGAANTIIVASGVAEQLAAELQYAIAINGCNATMIEFTVADRDANGVPETIRYEWSGTPGNPLTRQYNGGSVVEVLNSVQEFNLSYALETISEETPTGNESPETLLIGYDTPQAQASYAIKQVDWLAQYFLPSLPGDAINWKVTRVHFDAKASLPIDGEVRVQLQLPTAGNEPSGTVLEENTLMEATLDTTYLCQELTFDNTSGLSPQQGLCLVLRWATGVTACIIRCGQEGSGSPNRYILTTHNEGASWLPFTGQSMVFSVYGTVTTAGTPQIQQTYYVRTVDIKLRAGNDQQSAVYTAANTFNKPEVTQ